MSMGEQYYLWDVQYVQYGDVTEQMFVATSGDSLGDVADAISNFLGRRRETCDLRKTICLGRVAADTRSLIELHGERVVCARWLEDLRDLQVQQWAVDERDRGADEI